jgi:hypothetical protein
LIEIGILVDASGQKIPKQKISSDDGRCFLRQRLFFVLFPSAQTKRRTMKSENDVEILWQQDHENFLNAAIGFYELSMLDEAGAELSKIDKCIAAQSVPVLALRLMISYSRSDWNEMKAIARNLFLLDPSNPQWAFSDGYAAAKIDSVMSKED